MNITKETHDVIKTAKRLTEINVRANSTRTAIVEFISMVDLDIVDIHEIQKLREAEMILFRIFNDTTFTSICEYLKNEKPA